MSKMNTLVDNIKTRVRLTDKRRGRSRFAVVPSFKCSGISLAVSHAGEEKKHVNYFSVRLGSVHFISERVRSLHSGFPASRGGVAPSRGGVPYRRACVFCFFFQGEVGLRLPYIR